MLCLRLGTLLKQVPGARVTPKASTASSSSSSSRNSNSPVCSAVSRTQATCRVWQQLHPHSSSRPHQRHTSVTAWSGAESSTVQTAEPAVPAAPDRSLLQTLEERLGPLSTTPTVAPAAPLVLVISGPSGVGKDAVIKRLQEVRPKLHFVVTATSRPQRQGEVHGEDYLFVSKEVFEAWVAQDALLEHALVYGEYKGIPRQQVDVALRKGTDVVLRIDVQGAQTIRRLIPDAVSIFLVAESEAVLVQRLIDRKTEPLDKMVVRVETAKEETQRVNDFDYVVVNRDGELEKTVRQIEVILDAEKLRVSRHQKSVS